MLYCKLVILKNFEIKGMEYRFILLNIFFFKVEGRGVERVIFIIIF